jgi:hypothetical protein
MDQHQQQGKEMEMEQQQQLRQRQQQQEQQQQQQVGGEVVAPSPVLNKMQELVDEVVEQPDSTTVLHQPKQISAMDSTPNELMVTDEEEKDLHEQKVASDDSPDAVTAAANDDVVDALGGAETHEAVELNEERMTGVEDENSCEVVGKTPLPSNDAAATATTSAFEANIKEKDKDTTPLLTSCSSQSTTTVPFDTILNSLQNYESKYQSLFIPTSHPSFIEIVSNLVQNGIEEETYALWERNFALLKEYKERVGDCDVPFTAKPLGSWVVHQRELYAKYQHDQPQQQKQPPPQAFPRQPTTEIHKLYTSRFERLTQLGFDFSTPMWDVRLQELITYKSIHDHCSPPVSYPKLGIWVINQRFNLKDMPKERVEALDSLGFVWNHNRKNRSQEKWDGRYEERE